MRKYIYDKIYECMNEFEDDGFVLIRVCVLLFLIFAFTLGIGAVIGFCTGDICEGTRALFVSFVFVVLACMFDYHVYTFKRFDD